MVRFGIILGILLKYVWAICFVWSIIEFLLYLFKDKAVNWLPIQVLAGIAGIGILFVILGVILAPPSALK